MVNYKNVEIACKTLWKSPRKTRENFRAKLLFIKFSVQNFQNSALFHPLSPTFSPAFSPLFLANVFNISTDPTTTTINKLIERK